MNENKECFVYILVSQKAKYLKIGGTDFPPLKRIKEINLTEPYKSLGPWTLGDFRQVNDWRKIEHNLHYTFRSKKIDNIDGQRELFELSLQEASLKLNELNPLEIINKPKIDRMFQDDQFCQYLIKLFKFTGLMNWLDIQGAWTFVLFPGTNGGRYFTINIGPHEVAFSTLKRKTKESIHMIFMDKLILDYKNIKSWIKDHNGNIEQESYDRALPRSVAIEFEGNLNIVLEFLNLDGIRRAIIAYWMESLIILKERGVLSPYAKYHNYNAIAELNKKMQEIQEW